MRQQVASFSSWLSQSRDKEQLDTDYAEQTDLFRFFTDKKRDIRVIRVHKKVFVKLL